MFPNVSGGAGGIGGDTSAAGDIKNSNSLSFGSVGTVLSTSKIMMIGAGVLLALIVIKKV